MPSRCARDTGGDDDAPGKGRPTCQVTDSRLHRRYGRGVSAITVTREVGPLLREWRQRRRRSQLDLAVEAEVSTRHLSFVETGRSKPSRELLLHLAEHLDVPLRERNILLLAAGYAPVYAERSLDDASMGPVREAIDSILGGHDPYPAVVVDQRWNVLSANSAALVVFTDGVAPHLLEPPMNAVRVGLHPDGLAPRTENFAEFSDHMLMRLRRQIDLSADPELIRLYDEVRGYPGVVEGGVDPTQLANLLFVPLRIRRDDGSVLSFFSTLATFGTALDVTIAELTIESFFPADPDTAAVLRELSATC
jgi:transcriptional regulator with XRE-family HTH domain